MSKPTQISHKSITDYIDGYGLITTKSGDASASCEHQFAVYYARFSGRKPSNDEVSEILHSLKSVFDAGTKQYYQHVQSENAISHSATLPLICFLGISARLGVGGKVAEKTIRTHKQNMFRGLALFSPIMLMLWIRGARALWAYPLLWVLDVLLPIAGRGNLVAQTVLAHFCKSRMPTAWSWGFAKYAFSGKRKQQLAEAFSPIEQPPVDAYLNKLFK